MSATTQSVENGMAGELEGELHKVNRGGLLGVSSKKVFTVCNGSSLATYRSEHERAKGEAPLKHVPIRSDTRVEDTGLQRVSERKQLYTFALHYATVCNALTTLHLLDYLISTFTALCAALRAPLSERLAAQDAHPWLQTPRNHRHLALRARPHPRPPPRRCRHPCSAHRAPPDCPAASHRSFALILCCILLTAAALLWLKRWR